MKKQEKNRSFPDRKRVNIYYLKFTDYHPDVESIS